MNNLDKRYADLLQDILDNGTKKQTRNGEVISVFGRQIRHSMSTGFPLLTTKKMAWKQIVTELLWFLRGDTNIKFLIDNDCHIWDGDAYKNYLNKNIFEHTKTLGARPYTKEEFINKIKNDDEFAKKWGELGPIYGHGWRNWNGEIDQISELIRQLKEEPDSRRLVVSAWAVHDLPNMVLPPCHYGFQVYTRELSDEERLSWMKKNKSKVVLPARDPNVEFSMDEFFRPYGVPKRAISLMYNARSQDVPLGTPFNIASYALLLEIIAKQVNMIPDELITNMGDCHIYLNQIDGVKEQLTREPYELPNLKILENKVDDIAHYEIGDFIIEGYQSHPAIKMPLSN